LNRPQVGVWLALGLLMVAVAAGRFLQRGLTTPQPDQMNVPSPNTVTTSAGRSPTPGEVQADSVVSRRTIV
ncbi:MAG TPA: hypothetical protein VMM60_13725, partial [Ilumatobacter sp.]|nr:hypothetical protein [Ilumatobacter sp.]